MDHVQTYRRSAIRAADSSLPAWVGWLPILTLPATVWLLFPTDLPRWALMWTLSVVIYGGCKWLTWCTAPRTAAPWWQHAGYLFAWPGMDAVSFLRPRAVSSVEFPIAGEWWFAAGKTAFGVLLTFAVTREIPATLPYVAGWAGMTGLVFCLHFGLMHLLSCGWRRAGIDAKPLMHWPIAATSLSDFWANRWNTAFRDLTHRFLFRPLTPQFGARGALFVGFVFSGIVHDFVISASAEAGWGLPTLFFLIQAGGLIFERTSVGKGLGLGKGWRGWLFSATLLVGTSPLLFTPPFVERIVLPFLQAIGALP